MHILRERVRISLLGAATGVLASTLYFEHASEISEAVRDLRYGALLLLIAAVVLGFWPAKVTDKRNKP